MKVDGILFDLDGTLVDSLPDIAACMNRVLESHGAQPKDPAFYRFAVGDGSRRLVERCVEGSFSAQDVDALLEAYLVEYTDHLTDLTKIYDGISQLLDALDVQGLPIAIYSNKPDIMTREMVRRMFSTWTFQHVQGQMLAMGKKPDPETSHALLARLKWSPDRTLMVGDTSTDMKTATQAGMIGIGVSWGFRPPEELRQYGAQTVLEHPMDLLDVLNGDTIR